MLKKADKTENRFVPVFCVIILNYLKAGFLLC